VALSVWTLSASGRPARTAGDVTGRDPAGDVKVSGLTASERSAVDIVSIRAVGQEGIGVLVTVTFKGNFQAAFGRGHLKNAIAGLILTPQAGKGTPAGLVTTGSGAVGKILRHTRSSQVGAVRNGRRLIFFIAGPGYGSVAGVTVKVALHGRRSLFRRPASRSNVPLMPIADWQQFLETSTVVDRENIRANVGAMSEPGLKSLLDAIDATLTKLRALDSQLPEVTDDISGLTLLRKNATDELDRLQKSVIILNIYSSGYDHMTPGKPPGTYPSTVCAEFHAEVYYGTSTPTWTATLGGARTTTVAGSLPTGAGNVKVVFGIPAGGVTYTITVSISDGRRSVSREVSIPVPKPPPNDRSKDCGAPPDPA
jgi:hypothetical protein